MAGSDLFERAQDYAHQKGLVIAERLGFGVHGSVFSAKDQTKGGRVAIKVHERGRAYRQERDIYLRLQEHGVTEIRGCNVPELIAFDDESWIIEMTMVKKPFVLDFAGAYLDEPPDFPEEVWADWHEEKQEQFGPRWAEVKAILDCLEDFGVFMSDVNPGNISFDA